MTTCQAGMEAILKAELRVSAPVLRPAFSRPGFLTFKLPERVFDDALLRALPVFARTLALSLGPARDIEDVLSFARQVGTPMHLHVWSRERFPPGNEPREAPPDVAPDISRQLRAKGPELFRAENGLPLDGELVLDVVVVDESLWWVGHHRHRQGLGPLPGGLFPIRAPANAPSRAWQKIEEAIACFDLPVHAGQTAVEAGSAPGGVAMALLARGLRVVGIDSAAMAAAVLRTNGFRHVRCSVARVRAFELPDRVDWILCDIHTSPLQALRAVEQLCSLMREPPSGVVLTLKLGSPGCAARLPQVLARVRSWGLGEVHCRQLPSNRREVTVATKERA